MNSIAFIVIAILTLAAALAAATLQKLMHAALSFAVALVGVAAFFFSLGAEFVGLVLVFVYIGAVAVLIVFTILLTRRDVGKDRGTNWSGVIVAVAVFGGLIWTILETPSLSAAAPQIPALTVRRIGEALMTNYVWPLQCIGVLLTAALIGALIVGQGSIPGQGSAAIPLLIVGLLLSWAAAFGWTELVMMWPNRVGGIAATCAEAFRPYSPVLANLTGTCYWWGWVPTCGLTALLSASALHQWYLPWMPVKLGAVIIVAIFTALNLAGMKVVTRVAVVIAGCSAALAFLSGIIPVVTGHVDWHQAASFRLKSPFGGVFGGLTSAMAGLYLIGFAAPAFEAAACHVGETVDPDKNVPRAMYASAWMATLYFLVLPVVWLGVLGAGTIGGNGEPSVLAHVLGPTFAPLFGSVAKAVKVGEELRANYNLATDKDAQKVLFGQRARK